MYNFWISFIPFPSTTSLFGGKTTVIGLLHLLPFQSGNFSVELPPALQREMSIPYRSEASLENQTNRLEKQTRNYLSSHGGCTPVIWPIAQYLLDRFHILWVENEDNFCVSFGFFCVRPVSWSNLRFFFFWFYWNIFSGIIIVYLLSKYFITVLLRCASSGACSGSF